MTDYDNTNRGAVWDKANGKPLRAFKGDVDVNGRKYYIDMIESGRPAPAPAYNAYLTNSASHACTQLAIFRDPPTRADGAPNKRLGNGTLELGEGGAWWVSIFRNKSDKDRSPLLDISVQAKDPPAQQPLAPQPEDGGDISIPF